MKVNKKRGFTLVEIIVTIAIIGIILLIAIPSVLTVSKSIKRRELEAKKTALISAAEKYAKDNLSEYRGASILKIPVRTLIYYGYVPKDNDCNETIGCIINPTNGNSMNDEIITVKRNLAITQAIWGSVDEGIYATFFWNGADELNGNGYVSIGCDNGSSCTITNTPNITRSGFEIIGWGDNSNSREKTCNPGDSITITQNKNYYAVTKKDVSLTLYPKGGKFEDNSTNSKVSSCTIYNTKNSCTFDKPMSISKVGNSFVEWNMQENGNGIAYPSNKEIILSSSISLYAKWRPNRLFIQYNGNGGTWNINSNTYDVNEYGTVILKSDNTIYTQVLEYNSDPDSMRVDLIDYNGSWFKWKRTGYKVIVGQEYIIKDHEDVFLAQDRSSSPNGNYTATYLASSGGCDLSKKDCVIQLKVNWKAYVLTLSYNGNGSTGFTDSNNPTIYSLDSNGNLLKNGTIYKTTRNFGEKIDSNYGLINPVSNNGIKFTKYGFYVPSNQEWFVVNPNTNKATTFNESNLNITAEQIASAYGCDLSKQNCNVTLKVNWKSYVLTLTYNGNGSTGFTDSNNPTIYSLDSNGNLLKNGTIYKTTRNFGEKIDSNYGLINPVSDNGIKFIKSGLYVPSNQEWYVVNPSTNNKITFNENDSNITAEQIASAYGCNLREKNCNVTLKVNWNCAISLIASNGASFSDQPCELSDDGCSLDLLLGFGNGNFAPANEITVYTNNPNLVSPLFAGNWIGNGYRVEVDRVSNNSYGTATVTARHNPSGCASTVTITVPKIDNPFEGCPCTGPANTDIICGTYGNWNGHYDSQGSLCVRKDSQTRCCH